jgi:retron-type reverse transcriptase
MKRRGNLYSQICDIDNIRLAEKKSRKGKQHQDGVKIFDKDPEANIVSIHNMLVNKTYKTSKYTTFMIWEKKARLISRLPYFPDRIVHHAVMNILEPIFNSLFTADTYSCIKGRGTHSALIALNKSLKNVQKTKFCLKLDILKFYPSVNNEILKTLLRTKFKDRDLLWLLDEIIDSAKGLPIGNYLSQYFANFYLTGLDRFIKTEKKVWKYFRYMDDMVIPSHCKQQLHQLLFDIRQYLSNELQLTIKGNYQVFLVEDRGIDFVGYVSYHHECIYIRKYTKKRYIRMMIRNPNLQSKSAYWGLLKYGRTKNLIRMVNVNSKAI